MLNPFTKFMRFSWQVYWGGLPFSAPVEQQRIGRMPKKTHAFELWCLRRLLQVPWMARRSNQSILKEINPDYSLEGLKLKLKLQYFCPLMQIDDSWEKSQNWERLRTEREESIRGWDGWMASLMQRTWTWANSGRWWGKGGLACCSPWGHKELDRTGQLNNNNKSA